MRYIMLATLVAGSMTLSGCWFSDNKDNFEPSEPTAEPSEPTAETQDQINAKLAADQVSAVIDASNDVNTDEPQDISRIVLPTADTAEPVAVDNPNASY